MKKERIVKIFWNNGRELTPFESWLQYNKEKQYCRYAVWDIATGIMLACGEKYKVNQNLTYVESFRCWETRFRKVSAFIRFDTIKGRSVKIVFWFNTPKHTPFRTVTDAGLIIGLS